MLTLQRRRTQKGFTAGGSRRPDPGIRFPVLPGPDLGQNRNRADISAQGSFFDKGHIVLISPLNVLDQPVLEEAQEIHAYLALAGMHVFAEFLNGFHEFLVNGHMLPGIGVFGMAEDLLFGAEVGYRVFLQLFKKLSHDRVALMFAHGLMQGIDQRTQCLVLIVDKRDACGKVARPLHQLVIPGKR